MIDIAKIEKEIADNLNLDIEIVKTVCDHCFKYTIEVMKDDKDYHDILFNTLFKFKLKPRFKTDKTNKYSPKI